MVGILMCVGLQVSEFAPPEYQRILSYLVGLCFSEATTWSLNSQSSRLAVGNRLASFSCIGLFYAGWHNSRLDQPD
ncbi:hypothetical protein ES702_03664 [subsurface metagenome]